MREAKQRSDPAVQAAGLLRRARDDGGVFGSGTAPKAAPAATPSGGAPTSLAERVLWVAYGALAELPREQRARFETQLARGALDSLTTAMPAWIRSAGPDAESFRQHSFGPYSSAKASAQIQVVAAAVDWTDNLRPAMAAFAEAVQAIGLDNLPRALAAAAERAAGANAPAAAPLSSQGPGAPARGRPGCRGTAQLGGQTSQPIFNVTLPNHILAHGFVQRQIVLDGDIVMIRTTGVGNNSSPALAWLNTEAARPAFAGSTDQIRLQLGLTLPPVVP